MRTRTLMASSAAMVAAAGTALGFTNFVQIGAGGQKVVGTADTATGPVIVKIIQLAPPHAAMALERARREVGVLAAINHPNVVSLVSGLAVLGNPPDAVCWLEEKLDGADLNAIPNPPRAWADVAKLADDVLSGLTAFHAMDVVHRDLSPRNIRRLGSGDYKVMDPGIARLILETTITGAMDPGSPGHMSPRTCLASRTSDIRLRHFRRRCLDVRGSHRILANPISRRLQRLRSAPARRTGRQRWRSCCGPAACASQVRRHTPAAATRSPISRC